MTWCTVAPIYWDPLICFAIIPHRFVACGSGIAMGRNMRVITPRPLKNFSLRSSFLEYAFEESLNHTRVHPKLQENMENLCHSLRSLYFKFEPAEHVSLRKTY